MSEPINPEESPQAVVERAERELIEAMMAADPPHRLVPGLRFLINAEINRKTDEYGSRLRSLEEWREGLARAREMTLDELHARLVCTDSQGVGMIAAERARQIADEGYDAQRDDEHDDGALIRVAREIVCNDELSNVSGDWDDEWGLIAKHSRKPGGQLRLLVIAGALIAAEIDRRLRLGAEVADG